MRPQAWLISLTALLVSVSTWASHPSPISGGTAPCGILQKFDGEVQLMDPTRTHIIDTRLKTLVPCGGWVSVKEGGAEIRHRQGYLIRTGPHTFFEIYDNESDRLMTGPDQIVLYRGKILVKVSKGSSELRVITPNGRARLSEGVSAVIYDQTQQKTQLMALYKRSQLENRFESSRKIGVNEGEVSSLELGLQRVVPSTPMAMSVTLVKDILSDISLEKKELRAALRIVQKRAKRKFADEGLEKPTRALASDKKKANYKRSPASGKKPSVSEAEVVKKLMSGVPQAQELMFPVPGRKKTRTRGLASEFMNPQEQAKKKKEKKRVIDELAKIGLE